jgi:tripartite-type tricarboxylate transporter receptor subunit TctC
MTPAPNPPTPEARSSREEFQRSGIFSIAKIFTSARPATRITTRQYAARTILRETFMRTLARAALGALWGLLGCGTASPLLAQDYPERAVRVIVSSAPGGGVDRVARIVAEKLQERWNRPFPVENRAGASGNIAAELVFRSPPDGYLLMVTTPGPLVNNKSLYEKLSYEPEAFAPIAVLAESPQALAVHNKVEARNVEQLITLARANPDKLNYGSPGTGTTPHLTAELFKSMANLKMVHVPFKGSPPAFAALLGGQVDFVFDAIGTMLPHVKSGAIRALAVSTLKRQSSLPDTPAMAEILTGFQANTWYGMVAPPQTPVAVIDRLSTAVNDVLRQPDTAKRLRDLNMEAVGGPPSEATQFMRREREVWGKVIRGAGIKGE